MGVGGLLMYVHHAVNTPYVFKAAVAETPKGSPKDEKSVHLWMDWPCM